MTKYLKEKCAEKRKQDQIKTSKLLLELQMLEDKMLNANEPGHEFKSSPVK